METLGKTGNAILHGLTNPTANRGRQTLVNTFLDVSTNIFHRATNFAKSSVKTL